MNRHGCIGRYQLLRRIGSGGMADVYQALAFGPAGFRKIVAIKMIRPAMCEDREFVRMFEREAALAARICHPNAVQVFEFNRERGQHYLVMEYVEGVDLRTLLDRLRAPLPAHLAFYVAAKVLAALHHAHTLRDETGRCLRVLHRDVTPHNILVSVNGEVKLADFGIAKAQDSVSFTHANMVRGKLPYLSPEQARGETLDPRTDIYSLGLVLFEMLTGLRRFGQGRGASNLAEVMAGRFLPPSRIVPGLDDIVDRLSARLCASRREDRFSTADEARRAIERHYTWDGSACLAEYVRGIMPPAHPDEMDTHLLARGEDSGTMDFGGRDRERPTTPLCLADTRLEPVEVQEEDPPARVTPAPAATHAVPETGNALLRRSLRRRAAQWLGLGAVGVVLGFGAAAVFRYRSPQAQFLAMQMPVVTCTIPRGPGMPARPVVDAANPDKPEQPRIFNHAAPPPAAGRKPLSAAPRRTRVLMGSSTDLPAQVSLPASAAPAPAVPEPAAPPAMTAPSPPAPPPDAPSPAVLELKSEPGWE